MLVPSDSAPALAPQSPEYQPLRPAHLAGEEISGASRRLRALAALSGSLTDALGRRGRPISWSGRRSRRPAPPGAVVGTLATLPPPIAASAVARQFARLLGGDVIVASSALGRGRTFVVSLPVRYLRGTDVAPAETHRLEHRLGLSPL